MWVLIMTIIAIKNRIQIQSHEILTLLTPCVFIFFLMIRHVPRQYRYPSRDHPSNFRSTVQIVEISILLFL